MNSRLILLLLKHSILDTISMILTICGVYKYVVVDFGDPLSLLITPP